MGDVKRFDYESWCMIHLRPNSDVVQVTSNIADGHVAAMMADGIREQGGHVFAILPAGVMVAASINAVANVAASQRTAYLKYGHPASQWQQQAIRGEGE